ncbi:MAG: CPBP family intramembrane metalloprotease [Deferribacteraceae bacterium]|jgi:membrane protease YdiL (CAAX protease family)|nr:CPBP family intramembrane metalloprotease [Deferribacteraceae bacterium]
MNENTIKYISLCRKISCSKWGLLLQIVFVFLPPIFFFKSVYLLLGLLCSALLACGMLRLRGKTWKDIGFCKPKHIGRLVIITLITTVILLPLSNIVKRGIIALTGAAPNLKAFEVMQGNIAVLAGGLVIAWIAGAFLEEFLFRGFLLNTLYELFSSKDYPKWVILTVAVFVTSVFTGIGHFYQGIVGMIGTGFIAVGFAIIYLINRRNLWSCILAHGLYDTVAFILVYKATPF